jgi:hypothetical protein
LFLTIGAFAARPINGTLVLAAALALSLAGLPFTGGALAKLAAKASFGGFAGILASASSAASALLMLHFLSRVAQAGSAAAPSAAAEGLARHWRTIAVGAIFLPWLIYPAVGAVANGIALVNIWDGLWPVVIGAVLAIGLRRWGDRLPRVPEGDTVVVAEAAFDRGLALSAPFERIDSGLRQWTAGGLCLVGIALALAAIATYAR